MTAFSIYRKTGGESESIFGGRSILYSDLMVEFCISILWKLCICREDRNLSGVVLLAVDALSEALSRF